MSLRLAGARRWLNFRQPSFPGNTESIPQGKRVPKYSGARTALASVAILQPRWRLTFRKWPLAR
jgi:hypothetical protein